MLENSMDIKQDELNPLLISATKLTGNCTENVKSVSHLTSNGYYGFVPCNIQNYTMPRHSEVSTFANNIVNKIFVPILPTTKDMDNTTVFDSTCSLMDVQQPEFFYGNSTRAGGDSLGPNFERSKRALARDENEQEMWMECGIKKRIRYSVSCLVSNSDKILTEIAHDKDIAMESEDLDDQHVTKIGQVLPDSQNILLTVDQVIDPLVSFTKIKAGNTKYIDISRCVTSHMV